MQPRASSDSSASGGAARRTPRAVAAALLLVGAALTFGSLWLPWRHFRVPPGTTDVSPVDLAPYVPITDGLAHSYMVLTVLALAAGAAAWIITARRHGGQNASPLALGSLLFACASVLFAAAGVDGATIWRSSEVTDVGLGVFLAGYAALAAAAAILLASSSRARIARRTALGGHPAEHIDPN